MFDPRELPLGSPMIDGHEMDFDPRGKRLGSRSGLLHPGSKVHGLLLPNGHIACQANFACPSLERRSPSGDDAGMPARAKLPRPAPTTLKQWRLHKGLTLEQVANIIGVGPQAIHKWEAGKTPVEIETLKLLARIYETTPDALLYDPSDGPLIERMRRAYAVLKRLPEGSAEKWLGVGEDMAPKPEQK